MILQMIKHIANHILSTKSIIFFSEKEVTEK